MNNRFQNLAVMVTAAHSIDETFREMAKRSKEVAHAGLAVVLDPDQRLIGLLTDGDLRRAYANNINFAGPIADVMVRNPVTLESTIPKDEILPEVYRRVREAGTHSSDWIRHIPIVDETGRLIDILDFFALVQNQSGAHQKVAVFGLGYVGVTLAVSLANRGHLVTGIDLRDEVIQLLGSGNIHIHEPGLREMLRSTLGRKQISFTTPLTALNHDVYIITVGTPLDANMKPDLESIRKVALAIGSNLKRGDLVMLRSTVPTGTTRNVVIPELEKLSGLQAGVHFHVAFAPERTIEGKAMQELRTLPQVVGAYSAACLRKASLFWSTLTPAVVQVTSLEASEIVKLANNTFRDLSFAFANEIALLADESNVNAFELIRAANEGYHRNPIPLPSPGVGGYCLTKDPILFGCNHEGPISDIVLGLTGRKVNEKAGHYPIEVLKRFSNRIKKSLTEFVVLIVGIAFKGEPETTDIRGSVSVEIALNLQGMVKKVVAWDAVVERRAITEIGIEATTSLSDSIEIADAVLILNNHRLNVESEAWIRAGKKRLIFDGWSQLDVGEIEKVPGLVYATMGYMTPGE